MIFRAATLISIIGASTASLPVTRRLDQQDQDADYSWMSGYTLMYENCFHSDKVAAFRLCPSDNTCKAGCANGADYVGDLAFFIDAFTEVQMGARQYRCEMARENCEYDDEDLCYQDANLDYCADENEDENGFDLQEYLECSQISDTYYVGPYCSEDNYNIHLGVFEDADCSVMSEDASAFMDIMGYELPYTSEGIITNECAYCDEHALEKDQNGGDDADDEDDVLEQCEELYEASSKCETDLQVDNPDVSACDYLQGMQENENVSAGEPRSTSSTKRNAWIGIFITALILGCGGLGYWAYQRRSKKKGEAKEVEHPDNQPSKDALIAA